LGTRSWRPFGLQIRGTAFDSLRARRSFVCVMPARVQSGRSSNRKMLVSQSRDPGASPGRSTRAFRKWGRSSIRRMRARQVRDEGAIPSDSTEFFEPIRRRGAWIATPGVRARFPLGSPCSFHRCPYRLMAKDPRVSFSGLGFKSPWGRHPLVAQWIRAPDYESGGWRFESSRAGK
jgi:hypothetical protein